MHRRSDGKDDVDNADDDGRYEVSSQHRVMICQALEK